MKYYGVRKIKEDYCGRIKRGRKRLRWIPHSSMIWELDSLDVFQIIMGLEEEFDIEIPNEQAEKIVTVGDAVEQIKAAMNEN